MQLFNMPLKYSMKQVLYYLQDKYSRYDVNDNIYYTYQNLNILNYGCNYIYYLL